MARVRHEADYRRILQARTDARMTQEKLAEATELNIKTIYRLENPNASGKGNMFNPDTLRRVEEALGLPPGAALMAPPPNAAASSASGGRQGQPSPEESERRHALLSSADPAHISMRDRLAAHGVGPDPQTFDEKLLDAVGSSLVIDHASLDQLVKGFEGQDIRMLTVAEGAHCDTGLPPFVLDARRKSRPPEPNNPKSFISGWRSHVIDEGDRPTLTLSTSDYWTAQALQTCRQKVLDDLRRGVRSIAGLPRRLGVVAAVVTADDQLVLCKRSDLFYNPREWEASLGEQINPDLDRDEAGKVSPNLAIRRGLMESDELNLPENVAREAMVSCLALVTEWSVLGAHLTTLVQLPVHSDYVKDHFPHGEHEWIDTIPFDLPTCLALVTRGEYTMKRRAETQGRLTDYSRMGVLLSLIKTYGYEAVLAQL